MSSDDMRTYAPAELEAIAMLTFRTHAVALAAKSEMGTGTVEAMRAIEEQARERSAMVGSILSALYPEDETAADAFAHAAGWPTAEALRTFLVHGVTLPGEDGPAGGH